MISLIHLAISSGAIPLALKGLDPRSCNLELHYAQHLTFAGIVIAALIPTDFFSFIHSLRINELAQ
jgi:hypothetical protein